MPTYTRTVIFTRDREADLEVANARGLTGTDDEKLTRQLRDELQLAYDCDAIDLAGSFEVQPC